MAEAILRRDLAARGIADVTVRSAGTGAWEGAPASEAAYLVSLENDLDLSKHTATPLSREAVEDADLVIVMAGHHRVRAEELGGDGKTYLLGELAGRTGPEAEVSDPFGASMEVYRNSFSEIASLIEASMDRIVETLRAEN